MNSTKQEVLENVKKLLIVDMASRPDCFEKNENQIALIKKLDGRRRFPIRDHHVQIITMGSNVVISSVEKHMEWIKENIMPLERDDVFSIETLARLSRYLQVHDAVMCGPDIKLTCDKISFEPSRIEVDCVIESVDQVKTLYMHQGFRNALTYNPDSIRPDVVAVVAKQGKNIIGVASATEDSVDMYQVGIEVLKEYHGKGIGKRLVSELTEIIFDLGKIPYYSTTITNLASRNIAISLGYYPAWIEMYSR